LTLDVPPAWDDDTLVVLKAPVPQPSVRMRAATGEPRRPSLVVKRVPLVADSPLDALVEAEAEMLTQTIDQLALEAPTRIDIHGVHGVVRELTFPGPDGKLRQIHVSLVINRTYLCFVGTALDDVQFGAARDPFMAVVKSASIA
jgi:hypothetical protein